jgi:hypothetical protein
MIKITAPLSSLTAFIIRDTERLHLSTGEVTMPGGTRCPLASINFFRAVNAGKIIQRLSNLSGLTNDQLAQNIASISPSCPYFTLVKQTVDISIPPNQYDRIQTNIHRIGTAGTISFTINTIDTVTAVPALPGTDLPDPLALLFLIENRILCQAVPRLEIGITPSPQTAIPTAAAAQSPMALQPCG